MNKIYLILIALLVLIGSYFGYDYYTKMKMTQSQNQLTAAEMPSDEESEKILSDISKSSYFTSSSTKSVSLDFYYNENDREAAFVTVATVDSEGELGDTTTNCVFSKSNGNWQNIQCFEDAISCDAMDKAGLDRETTIENSCVEANGQVRN